MKMRSSRYRPSRLIIEDSVRDLPITRTVLRRLPTTPVQFVPRVEVLLEETRQRSPGIAQGKTTLLLCRHKGRFFKPCPAATTPEGTSNVCCNYFVVNFASNCHMECSYCYLQGHLNLPYMVIYANHEELLEELSTVFNGQPESSFRVGTGELADSLALDHLTGYSVPLVNFFARQRNAVLEFKTKSDCVENFLDLEHRGRTVVSWSINPTTVQKEEEHKTANLDDRLRAASLCAEAGYPIVFHFDPIVHYENWERDYRLLVEEVFDRIPPRSIPWVSLGALRMTPHLKQIMRQRFPHSRLPLGELVPTEDGKLRYFKPIRLEMLQKMQGWIAAASPETRTYTCMENAHIWSRVYDRPIPTEVELGDSLLQLL